MASGKTFHSPFFTIIIVHNSPPYEGGDQEGVSRFSVITSVKFHPHSVKRHQVKRLICQIIRENLSTLPQNLEVIIIPKKPILSADKSSIFISLIKTLSPT